MKYRQKVLSLILSMVMVLTLMPAMAFADDDTADENARPAAEEVSEEAAPEDEGRPEEDTSIETVDPEVIEVPAEAEEAAEPESADAANGQGSVSLSTEGAAAPKATVKPTKMTFTLGNAEKPINGYIGTDEARFYQPDNKIVITYSNGTTKTFRCVKNDSGYYRYYLNGNKAKSRLNQDRLEVVLINSDQIKKGNNAAYLRYEYKDACYVRTKVNVVGVTDSKVKSVSYVQNNSISVGWLKILYEPLDWQYEDKNFNGDVLTVTVEKDGADITETFPYQWNPEEGYRTFYSSDYGEAEVSFMPDIKYENWLPGKTYDVGVYYHGVKADETFKIKVTSTAAVPNEVVFTPAEGYVPSYFIGESDPGLEAFMGEGCEGSTFTVKYNNGTEKTYIAKKHPKYGYYVYYLDGDTGKATFDCSGTKKGGLVKGANLITYTYDKYISSLDETATVRFPVTVYANQYAVYAEGKTYKYTGSPITPKFVVKNSVGKTLVAGTKGTEEKPATGDYYVKYTPTKKIGTYRAEIIFNDGLAERELYPDSTEGYYTIKPPKAPVLKSVTGGTKKITVKWTKFTAAQRKLIDGFIIEIATDKNFYYNYKMVKVGKLGSVKTIKNLKKNKKYYVRMCAYKNFTPEGSTKKYPVYSSNSKRKYAKTK